MISPLIAIAVWAGLEHDWKINALRGDYADPSHEAHNLHLLAEQLLAGADEEFWRDLGISPSTRVH